MEQPELKTTPAAPHRSSPSFLLEETAKPQCSRPFTGKMTLGKLLATFIMASAVHLGTIAQAPGEARVELSG